jgi:hypothetical protein
LAGHPDPDSGADGDERPPAASPGCWTLMNRLRKSGVALIPVISQAFGPVRKRRISPLATSCDEHLVVAKPLVVTTVEDAAGNVGLDPQPTFAVKTTGRPGWRKHRL